ncbi:hypothetical protein [Acutalibacter sp. 1XD8-36]|uniref:hypothetical protein n=1 Tax=Acutalibacter sp. 1XD8-36 TaxID=2320852 RepID=UPI0014131345|nr:hypothetical protein [Acutalibacter sp. 1XD8-36]NBJ90978.1 hypothetical protein [Acutalibacter sp. 1XD8-36]
MEIKAAVSDLLPDKFFQENTPYASFDDFLAAGGFYPETKEDIEAIPQPDIDAHVAATTKFNNWHELMELALKQFLSEKLN